MTDYRSDIAGSYKNYGPTVLCILDEGAVTNRSKTVMPQTGQEISVFTYASPLYMGQVVALSNDTANTYAATEGMPVVERAVNAETLVVGQIVSEPQLLTAPSTTDADNDTLAERLAAKTYRVALVEFHISGTVKKCSIMANGSNALVPGVMTTLNFNMASAYASGARGYHFDSAAANGVGGIPLHYVGAGSDGDLYSALVLLTAMNYAVTGTA